MTQPRKTYTEQELLDTFPWISWREPQLMRTSAGSWLHCRFCTAILGISAAEVPERGFENREDFASHMRREHPDLVVSGR